MCYLQGSHLHIYVCTKYKITNGLFNISRRVFRKHAILKSGPDLIYLYGKDNAW